MNGQYSKSYNADLGRTELANLRKVNLKKISGNLQGRFPLGLEATGFEVQPPSPGKPYCLYIGEGKLIRTSVIMKCRPEGFRTRNSRYSLVVLDQQGD
jgi:hypothetical protein